LGLTPRVLHSRGERGKRTLNIKKTGEKRVEIV